ncbi:hypothetical protein GCM10027059_26110 [Myceligenerans halotolerans]
MTTTRARNRVMCTIHDQTNPCAGCASDHLAAAHAPGDHLATCRRCRAACRKPRTTPPTYQPPPMPDYAALAAGDDTDYDLEEDDDW